MTTSMLDRSFWKDAPFGAGHGTTVPPRRFRPVRVGVGAVAVCGAVAMLAGCGAFGGEQQHESESFDSPDERLVIEADYRLTVRPHQGDEVEVERWTPKDWEPSVTMDDGTLALELEEPPVSLADGRGEVRVPQGVAVEVRMANSPLELDGFTDGVTVRKENGAATLTDVAGTVDVEAVNGDVELVASGKLAETSVTTDNGSIDLQAPESVSQATLSANNGDLHATLGDADGAAGYAVTTEATDGDVEVDVPRNESGPSIDASSTNGDITLETDS